MQSHVSPVPVSQDPFAELDRLGDGIAELSAHLDAATARLLDLIREFDARGGWNSGFRSCAAWLSWRVGLDLGAARERVRVARALGTLPLLAQALAGDIFFAFIAAIAFATILAVVAGLTISASTSFAHDFYTAVIHKGTERRPGEEVRVARITAFFVGAVAIAIAIVLGKDANVAFLVALAFAVAASANLPVIVFSLFWKRFNTAGAVMGLATGLAASIVLILISPSIMKVDAPTVVASARHLIQRPPIFPLENPGILSIPLGFLGAVIGTFLRREPAAEGKFAELIVRANTGLGSEKAVLD
jgi:cation/acetate symporter